MLVDEVFEIVPEWINPAASIEDLKLIYLGFIEESIYYKSIDDEFCENLVIAYGSDIFEHYKSNSNGATELKGNNWQQVCKSLVMAATESWVLKSVTKLNNESAICTYNSSSITKH